MTALPSREQIERAQPLDMNATRSERQANVKISGQIDGIGVEIEFTSSISAIPSAIEKLRAIGLSSAPRSMAPALAATPKGKSTKVQPIYDGSGDPCCPKHTSTKLREGKFGLYCPAKDDSTERGYCALKFDA